MRLVLRFFFIVWETPEIQNAHFFFFYVIFYENAKRRYVPKHNASIYAIAPLPDRRFHFLRLSAAGRTATFTTHSRIRRAADNKIAKYCNDRGLHAELSSGDRKMSGGKDIGADIAGIR